VIIPNIRLMTSDMIVAHTSIFNSFTHLRLINILMMHSFTHLILFQSSYFVFFLQDKTYSLNLKLIFVNSRIFY